MIKTEEFKALLKLINSPFRSINDFQHDLLMNILQKTGSRKGFVFIISEKEETFELSEAVLKDHGNKSINEYVKTFNFSEAGQWGNAVLQNNHFVLNSGLDLIALNNDNGVYEAVTRLCAIPIFTSGGVMSVLVISDKESDYDDDDAEYLELAAAIGCTFAENIRIIDSLTLAKEKAEKGEERKSSYLINLAHEIKSPVNAISGFSSLLKEIGQSEENRRKFIDIILESSKNLVSITNSVVEISNFESGAGNIVEKAVVLNDLIKEVYEEFSQEALVKKLLLQTKVTFPAEERIMADRSRLKQILLSLLSNSFRFTYSGKIVFGYKLKDEFIEFFVSDTGSGISEENKNLVFDHFFQAGDSLSNSFKGVGLGLTIAKGYVERMGGKMWLDSCEGKGSDFYFTIPYKGVLSMQLSEIKPETKISKQTTKRKIILVAEDDDINFTLINTIFSKLDVEIVRAENGKIAVELCKTNKFDLILMDIRMPVMDGYTATRLIKDNNPEQIIIAQTAYTNDREKALSNGCNDFIAKPFTKVDFLSVVNTYI